ncbi:uncharacterized protein [Musca autumnalis]|uniref:uncharacterized protein n=1 Tax=Musca autumnalis TaxID=221902 RepID=UPI003CEBF151
MDLERFEFYKMEKPIYLLVFLILSKDTTAQKKTWTYELQKLEAINETPDIVEVHVERRLVSRGVYRSFGEVDIKQDLTDDLQMEIYVMYSTNGRDFYRTPFHVPKGNLTFYINNYYMPIFMESFSECCDNLPALNGTFEAPLTARHITIANCVVNTENMPSHLKSGYYRITYSYMNQARGSITSEALVHPI